MRIRYYAYCVLLICLPMLVSAIAQLPNSLSNGANSSYLTHPYVIRLTNNGKQYDAAEYDKRRSTHTLKDNMPSSIKYARLSPAGNTVAVCADSGFSIWRLSLNAKPEQMFSQSTWAYRCNYSQDGKYLAVSLCHPNSIVVLHISPAPSVSVITSIVLNQTKEEIATEFQFNNWDTSLLAITERHDDIRIYRYRIDSNEWNQIISWKKQLPLMDIADYQISPDCGDIAVGSAVDCQSDEYPQIYSLDVEGVTISKKVTRYIGFPDSPLLYSPDGKYIVLPVYNSNDTMELVVTQMPLWNAVLQISRNELFAAYCFSSDSLLFAIAEDGAGLRIWNMKNGKLNLAIPPDDKRMASVSLGQNGSRVAVATDNGDIYVHDTITGKEVVRLLRTEHNQLTEWSIARVDFNSSRNVIFAASQYEVLIWNVQEGML